jgi:ubiquitin-protein ligase
MDSTGAIRLQKECRKILARTSLDNYIALPCDTNIFVWNFLIFGLRDCDYEGGFYHGKITFPP